jgi:hypothetical protein
VKHDLYGPDSNDRGGRILGTCFRCGREGVAAGDDCMFVSASVTCDLLEGKIHDIGPAVREMSAFAKAASDDEVDLFVPREMLADYKRGDVVDLDCARAKGRFEVMGVDMAAQTLTVRPQQRTTTSARGERPNRHERRAALAIARGEK